MPNLQPIEYASETKAHARTSRTGLQFVFGLLSGRAFLSIVDQAAISITSFLTMVALGRIGEVELGIYALAVTILWLSASMPNTLIWIPFAVRYPKLAGNRAIRFERAMAWHVLVFLALMIFPVAIATSTLPNRSFVLFACMYVFVAGTLLREHLRRVLMSKLDMRTLLSLDVSTSAAQLIALFSLWNAGEMTSTMTMLLHGCIVLFPSVWLITKTGVQQSKFIEIKHDFLRNWHLGRWLVGASVIGAACDASVRIAVYSTLGIVEFGRFTAAYSLPLILNPLILTLGNWLRVSIAHQAVESNESALIQRAMRLVVYFSIFGSMLFGSIAFLGELAGTTVYGEKYAGLGMTIASLCGVLVVYTTCLPIEIALTTINRTRTIMVANAFRLAFMLLIVLPLILYFGLVGGGLTYAFGALVSFGIQFSQLRQRLQPQFKTTPD